MRAIRAGAVERGHADQVVALFKDGHLVWMLERHQIEGRTPYEIADALRAAYDEHCAAEAA